ncbi:flagellar hook-basal body complex protein FlhP [Bacillus sp. PS93]|uniref:flagellar hook-basal body complex protein FlhP n=1 Tax=Bacillus TaxID=1386 RepID=UPI0004E439B3|nr:flagellar hook-basal body complex protein FlhP [Bacillus subtilis]KFC29778.1 flagellar hook-basal body protein FlhP [Bacillus subtilis]MCM3009910.1 flagellar hook-basal body complex protein FlhP [Bacillus subtilis]MDK8207640.1 flagellar hook-basal body complex protein FlhP [Bacillus subtilis]MED4557186.1 flagellar hook-basal body complex protein FlhP [Bacillus subtilis]QHM03090.1 Flagellar basal-body rod protein FlgG [Bacillus subtilis]
MLRSMLTASTTLNQLQQQIDTISSNLSNSNTTGYKAKDTNFSELVRQQFDQVDEKNEEVAKARKTPPGLRLGVGAMMNSRLVSDQGSIQKTDRDLDIAFTSPYQYLQVNVNGNRQYTRDGALYVTPSAANANQLQLVTGNGYPVLDENGNTVNIDSSMKNITINKNGTLTASDGNAVQRFNLGVVQVNNPQELKSEGNNLFSIDNAVAFEELNGANRQNIGMQQGSLEMSNVDISEQMTDLITSQRSYQLNSRTITMGDQMLGLINSVR